MSESIGKPDRTPRIESTLAVFDAPGQSSNPVWVPRDPCSDARLDGRSILFRPECMRDRLHAEADASLNLADATPRAAVTLLPARGNEH
jgi:hypothetical protein